VKLGLVLALTTPHKGTSPYGTASLGSSLPAGHEISRMWKLRLPYVRFEDTKLDLRTSDILNGSDKGL
jgi:hypothetical protein